VTVEHGIRKRQKIHIRKIQNAVKLNVTSNSCVHIISKCRATVRLY